MYTGEPQKRFAGMKSHFVKASLLVLALAGFYACPGDAKKLTEFAASVSISDRQVVADSLSSWNDGATKSAIICVGNSSRADIA